MQVEVALARFPYGAAEHPAGVDWLMRTYHVAKCDPRIKEVQTTWEDDTPITMTRNLILKKCLDRNIDLLVMLDSDLGPDDVIGEPGAKPFWESSFNHWWDNYLAKPAVIFAPYCGRPPREVPMIFHWCTWQGDHPNPDWRMEMYSREESATRTGFETVAAGPTGLMLIDMRAIKLLPPPWFEYEWQDPPFNTIKGSTEDVVFTRNLSMLGVPQIVNWDAWAAHYKTKRVRKPGLISVESIAERMREPLIAGRRANERVMVMGGELPNIVPAPSQARAKNATATHDLLCSLSEDFTVRQREEANRIRELAKANGQ